MTPNEQLARLRKPLLDWYHETKQRGTDTYEELLLVEAIEETLSQDKVIKEVPRE